MDSWIVSAWRLKTKKVFQIGLVDDPVWSLKNKEMFRIGLMDRPRVLFWIGPQRALKNRELFQIGPKYFV